MIRYSHVSLLIPCEANTSATITDLLGVQPTAVLESKSHASGEDGRLTERTHHTWSLQSSLTHLEGDPTARLYALADLIEPFASRLQNLRPRFDPHVDILYHVTPQYPDHLTGDFDWFRIPADLMRRFGSWDLSISYETIWFDHPARAKK